MTDHSMLMRAANERDISHVRLAEAVAFIEANMEPEAAAEAISLLHAAISPAHAVKRQRDAEEFAQLAATPEGDEPKAAEPAAAPKKPGRGKKAAEPAEGAEG